MEIRSSCFFSSSEGRKKRQWLTSSQAAAVEAAFDAWGGDWKEQGEEELESLAAAVSLPPRTIKKRLAYLRQKKKTVPDEINKDRKKREWLTPLQAQEIELAFHRWGGEWEGKEDEVIHLAAKLGLPCRKVKKRCAYLRSKSKGKGKNDAVTQVGPMPTSTCPVFLPRVASLGFAELKLEEEEAAE